MDDKKFSMQDLKKAGAAVADRFGVDVVTGCKLLGFYNAGEHKDISVVADIVAGDYSAIPAAAAALSVSLSEKTVDHTKKIPDNAQKITTKKRSAAVHGSKSVHTKDHACGAASVTVEKITEPRQTDGDGVTVEKVTGDIIAETAAGVLPDNVPALIMDVIQSYCDQNNISDLSKERQPRWRAACFMVGQTVFKNSKILHDLQREKINGGIVYDVGRVSALVDVWGVLCANFCKAPMIDDFAHFAAVSDTWLYGANSPDGLTPTRAALLQKIKRIQESGLSALIVDGRQNPTGALAALNHWHGWTQQREIIHTTGAAVANAQSLPILNVSAGILTDKTEESSAES